MKFSMLTEKEKMLRGELYQSWDPILKTERKNAKLLCQELNATTENEKELRKNLLKRLLGKIEGEVFIEPPFYCDYGYNISLGEYVFMNHGCVFLDVNKIDVGRQTMLGPYVQVLTATHPLNPEIRLSGVEYAKPIKIGQNVWIGGGVIICPGVNIGDNTTIGAGAVVTKDIPANVLAVGNPCKIVKRI